jgi:hypothetical protein
MADKNRKYISGTWNGQPVTEAEMNAREAAQHKNRSPTEVGMDDYADKAKARMTGKAMNRATAKNELDQEMAQARTAAENELDQEMAQARARMVKRKSGGRISASSRADGIAQRGKTRGKIL